MIFRKKKPESSKEEQIRKTWRIMLTQTAEQRLMELETRKATWSPEYPPSMDDLLTLSLLGQDLYNRATENFARNSTRLARILTFLTAVLVIATGADIILRIFN
jgi:hypothetical protein